MMNELKDTLCYKLLEVYNQIHETTKSGFQELGITRENYVTMYFIGKNPGITQAELADIKRKDRNVIGKNIDKLEEKQYVQRVRGKQDRRSFSLYLTEAGEQVVRDYWDVLMKGDAEQLKKLTTEEQQVLMELLDKMMS